MNELKEKLAALGLSEETTDKTIQAVLEFVKGKLPENLHGVVDDVLAGKSPDLGAIGGLGGIGGMLGSLFGGKK